MADQGLLDGILFCQDHGCPMIRVGDNYECVIERVDGHLGGKRVKDIVPPGAKTPLTLVFEDGHTIPLFCPDCGGALHVAPQDEDEVLSEISGCYLVGVAYVEAGDEPEGLALAFARDLEVDPDDPEALAEELVLHLDSARQLICPDQKNATT